jgi:hypothetical protein
MAYPYLKVAQEYPYAKRSWAEVALYSPPLKGFFVAPLESAIWGSAHEGAREAFLAPAEMTLLPGFALYAMAAVGLFYSVWTLRQRLLLAGGVVLSIALAMGAAAPAHGRYTYGLLYNNLPGFDGLRTPGRLVIWTTLLLGLLAAGMVSALPDPGPARGESPWAIRSLRLAAVLPMLVVLGEGINNTPHPVVPTAPASFASAPAPLLVLPTSQLGDEHVMLWSTDGFPKIVNGGSGFTPRRLAAIREATRTFPDEDSIALLRSIGVKSVVVLRDEAIGTAYQGSINASVDGLGITREDHDDVVIYRLS